MNDIIESLMLNALDTQTKQFTFSEAEMQRLMNETVAWALKRVQETMPIATSGRVH
jgi:hypothetical protein